jgi:hypothetical protein
MAFKWPWEEETPETPPPAPGSSDLDDAAAGAQQLLSILKTTVEAVDTVREVFDDSSGSDIESYAEQMQGPGYLGQLLEYASRRHGINTDADWSLIAQMNPWTGLASPMTALGSMSLPDQRRFFANGVALALASSYKAPLTYKAAYDAQQGQQQRMGWCKPGSKGCDPKQATEGILPDGVILQTDLYDYQDALDRLAYELASFHPTEFDPESPPTTSEKGHVDEGMSTTTKVVIGVAATATVGGILWAIFKK